MKKILLAVLAVSFVTASALAQDRKDKNHSGHGMEKHEKMMGKGHDKNLDELNLNQSQKDQIIAINENFRTQMQNLKSQNLTAEERRNRMHELQKQHVDAIRNVLTPEQRTRFDEMKKDKGKAKMKYKEKIG